MKKETQGDFRDACEPPSHHSPADGRAAAGCSPGRQMMLEDKNILLILAPVCCLPWCTCMKPQMSTEPRSALAEIELPAVRDQLLSPCDVPHPAILEVIIQSICNPTYI